MVERPRGPETIIKSRRCSASGRDYSSAHPSGNAPRRGQFILRGRDARRQRRGHGRSSGRRGIVGGGACSATAVVAAEASAGPVPPSELTAKTEAKVVSAVSEMTRRPGRRSMVVVDENIATDAPGGE